MTEIILAVVGREMYPISVETSINKLTFNDRPITLEHFKHTFFDQNIFCIKPNCLTLFEGTYDFDRTSCPSYVPSMDETENYPFKLERFLFQCASADLNFATITYTSRIELKKNVNNINYLSDLKVMTSLRRSDIESSLTLGTKFHVIATFINPNCNVKNAVLDFTFVISETDLYTV